MLTAFTTFTGNPQLGANVGQLGAAIATHIANLLISNLAANTYVHGYSSVEPKIVNANENDCQQQLYLLLCHYCRAIDQIL